MNSPSSQTLIVGVADCQATDNANAQLVTYALGSCLGITLYDPVHRIGGLLHLMLPDSKIHRAQENRPAMYADTGIPLLIDMVTKLNALPGRLVCKIFGGAQVLNADSYFRIGERNIKAAEELLNQHSIQVQVWEVGGQDNRTIRLAVSNGEVKVHTPNREDFIL